MTSRFRVRGNGSLTDGAPRGLRSPAVRTSRWAPLLGCVLALLCGCKAAKFYGDSELGFEVEGLDWSTAKHTVTSSGEEDFVEDGDVEIAGLGTHDVDLDLDVQPVTAGGKQTLTVDDTVTGNRRIFSFDPLANSLTFSDGAKSLSVVQNPDKSYAVDGKPAANGKAAVALLKTSPVYTDASAWGFVMTYSVCQSCLELAAMRASPNCNNNGTNRPASAPAVCDIFRDLCDCAICDKLGKTSCAKCP